MSTYRAAGGEYVNGPTGKLVQMLCTRCGHITLVTVEWRREHIGEQKQCWECGYWLEIPVLAMWERGLTP